MVVKKKNSGGNFPGESSEMMPWCCESGAAHRGSCAGGGTIFSVIILPNREGAPKNNKNSEPRYIQARRIAMIRNLAVSKSSASETRPFGSENTRYSTTVKLSLIHI